MIHVMFDIETLGKGKNAALVSLSAVKFDANDVLDRFEVGIDPASCQRAGLTIDAETVMWWMDPKRDEARKYLMELAKIDLFYALDGFTGWVWQTPLDERGSAWGKGATFDNVLVKAAYEACQLEYPFTYRQDECYRTLANRFPDVEYKPFGISHVGVDDAHGQALHLIEIAKAHGIVL